MMIALEERVRCLARRCVVVGGLRGGWVSVSYVYQMIGLVEYKGFKQWMLNDKG
jgi:hypothetical protein